MTFSPRLIPAALLAAALFACFVPQARAAVHWPAFGGDAGRSGSQPVDAGAAPVVPVWQHDDGTVRTAPVITASGTVAYGTADGVVHLRRLADGGAVGNVDVGNDADVFGPVSVVPGDNRANVAFADTGEQIAVAHNDGANIDIARIDAGDGNLAGDATVPGTNGMTIASSLLAAPGGDLFFVAGERLFKVPASGTATSTPDVNANPIASPALLNLDVLGTPTPHIAIGTSDGFLRTYRASDLAPGPFIDLKVSLGGPVIAADDVMTPSVPVLPTGALADEAPFVYVAASGVFPFFPPGGDDTIAYKLHVVDGAFEFNFEFLPIPDTDPAPALAVSQLASGADPEDIPDGEVLIPTATNLFLSTTRDMDLTGEIDFESDLVAGNDGFRQSTPSTSGPNYYVTDDAGRQIVGRLSDGKTVPEAEFTRQPTNAGADSFGSGQPAISRGFIVFGGPDGVFAYRDTDASAPTVELTAPADGTTVSGMVTVSATAEERNGIAQVAFFANGRSIGADMTAPYSVVLDTTQMAAGEYVLDARATDNSDRTAISSPRRIVVPARSSEDTPPTVAFTSPAAGAHLSGTPTLAATATDDRGVASVRFLAGERVVCTDATVPYDCAYRLTADDVGRTTLIAVATDSAGQTGAAVRTVTVNRFAPRSLSAKTTPRTDRRRPFRFTTRGVLRLPAGVTRKQACAGGDVAVQIKAARKTISTRRVALSRTCSYRSRVTFRSRSRFPKSGKLTVRVRFLGNAVLASRRAKSATVRTRP